MTPAEGRALRATILTAMERALQVAAIDHVDEVDEASVRTAAKRLAKAIETENTLSLDTLFLAAISEEGRHDVDPDPINFGWSLAMESLGSHDDAWSNDHPRFGLRLPDADFDGETLSLGPAREV